MLHKHTRIVACKLNTGKISYLIYEKHEIDLIFKRAVGWHHRLDGHEFEQAPGIGDGQGSLVCFSLWGCKESDTTE